MGVYSDGKIYGISLKLNNQILFEKISSDEMIVSEIQELKELYDKLDKEEKVKLNIKFYNWFSTTYSTFMSWVPSDYITLERLIN
jgi:hypothetical protein